LSVHTEGNKKICASQTLVLLLQLLPLLQLR